MVRPQQQEVPYSRSDDVDDYNYNGRRYLFGADDEYDQEKEEDTITPNDKDDITNDVDDKDNDWWRLDDDEEGPNLPTKVGGEEEEGWWKLFGSSLSFSSLDPHDSLVGSFFFDKQPQQPKWNGSKAHPRHHHHHRGRLLNTDDGWNALDWTWSYHDLFHSVVFLLAAYVGGKIVGGTSSGRRRRQRSRGVTAASTSTKSSSFVCRDWIPAIPSWVGHVLVGLVLGPPLANWVRTKLMVALWYGWLVESSLIIVLGSCRRLIGSLPRKFCLVGRNWVRADASSLIFCVDRVSIWC